MIETILAISILALALSIRNYVAIRRITHKDGKRILKIITE